MAGITEGSSSTQSARLPQPFREIEHRLPGYQFKTILDVGANVGQSSVAYVQLYPGAKVWFFEPVPASYEKASEALLGFPNVIGVQAAVSARDGSLIMEARGTSTGNKVVSAAGGREHIEVRTLCLDSFASANALTRVNFLKIDVEGHETEVIAGAKNMLAYTDFVQLELGMNLGNKLHTPYNKAVEIMDELGFSVFLICKQMYERGFPELNRSDTVFINRNTKV